MYGPETPLTPEEMSKNLTNKLMKSQKDLEDKNYDKLLLDLVTMNYELEIQELKDPEKFKDIKKDINLMQLNMLDVVIH